MSSMNVFRTVKQCSTCSKWAGQRTIDMGANYVVVVDVSLKGACLYPGRGRPEWYHTHTCEKFDKWGALR